VFVVVMAVRVEQLLWAVVTPQSLAFVVALQPLSHLEVEVVVRYAA
jgi:hypothetical protein